MLRIRQVLAHVTKHRVPAELSESVMQPINDLVGGIDVVNANVIPDFEKVRAGRLVTSNDLMHGGGGLPDSSCGFQ